MASRELNILIKAKNLASQTINGIKGDLKGLGRIGSKAGRNLAANFERGVVAAGAGLAGFTVLAIKTAADFEDAFAGVIKTVDETELAAAGLDFTDLMDQFRQMAREMPIAFEELAAIGEAAGALGIAAGDIDEFTETVAKLGVTTDLTSDQAATALGHLGTILGLTGQDFEDVADSLVALGNDGASTESQIIGIAERFAAAGNQAGLAKEDILALSSTAASMGIEVEAAGSSLSRIFNQTTTNIGTANDKADAFADALGLSFDDFKKAWETDALGTFQDLLKHLDTLDQFEAAALLKDIGVTGVRDINAIQLLAGGYDELTDQIETARTAQGALNEEAGKKFATTASQWKRFQNVMRDVGFVIGRELLPIVNDLMTEFTEFLATDAAQGKIKQFAKDFAQHVRDAASWLQSLDWAAIGSALQTAAGAGKALLDAFLGMPSWIQGAIASGWGLNKLTGGALGDLIGLGIGGAAKGLFGNRGSTPANPVYTKEVGLGGAGGPVAPGNKGGGPLGLLGPAGIAAAALAAVTIAGEQVFKTANPTGHSFNQLAGQTGVSRVKVEGDLLALSQQTGDSIETLQRRAIPLLESGDRTWNDVLSELRTGVSAAERAAINARDAIPWHQRNVQAIQDFNQSEGTRFANLGALSAQQKEAIHSLNASEGARAATQTGLLSAINAKKTSVTAIINTSVNVNLQQWQRAQISSIRANSNSGGFI